MFFSRFTIRHLLPATFLINVIAFTVSAHPEDDDNIESLRQMCFISPAECIERGETLLTRYTPYSAAWFEAKTLEMKAYFHLVQVTPILNQVPLLLEAPDLPLRNHLSLLIYYSKALKINGKKQLSTYYAEKASQLITHMNNSTDNAMAFIEYGNLLLDRSEHKRAKQVLLRAQKIIDKNGGDLFEKIELNGNLGHIAWFTGDYEGGEKYRIRALENTLELGSDQQTAVAHYNLARTYQKLERNQDSLMHFNHAFRYARSANDQYQQDISLIRIAELTWKMTPNDDNLASLKQLKSKIDLSNPMTAKLYQNVLGEISRSGK